MIYKYWHSIVVTTIGKTNFQPGLQKIDMVNTSTLLLFLFSASRTVMIGNGNKVVDTNLDGQQRLANSEGIPANHAVQLGLLIDGNAPESSSGAFFSLPTPGLPSSWTICSSFNLQNWPSSRSEVFVWKLFGSGWLGYLQMTALENRKLYVEAQFNHLYVRGATKQLMFPGRWIRTCFSHQKLASKLSKNSEREHSLVVDGSLIDQQADKLHYIGLPPLNDTSFTLFIGKTPKGVDSSVYNAMVSDLNMFSLALPLEKMKSMTNSGQSECGLSGDLVPWTGVPWTLVDNAVMVPIVEDPGKPCWRRSTMRAFIMEGNHRVEDCMQLCQKIGRGRSPPVANEMQWNKLKSEMETISADNLLDFPAIWLSVTEGDKGGRLNRLFHWPLIESVNGQLNITLAAVEGVWRDYYTGARVDVLSVGSMWDWIWEGSFEEKSESSKKRRLDEEFGEEHNCLTVDTMYALNWNDIGTWRESTCSQIRATCLCQYQMEPIVTLRGLCKRLSEEKLVDSLFVLEQNSSDPLALYWQGSRHSIIKFDDNYNQWNLISTVHDVAAISKENFISYGLGVSDWEVSGDTYCSTEEKYTTELKLTGCNQEGQFTCHDGQCIRMDQRCNQLTECQDKSDEINCHMLLLEKGYNKNVPPVPALLNAYDVTSPVQVRISIILMKVVEIEEADHSIHLQFQISLTWRENRVKYFNLKTKSALNALTKEEMKQLWLPLVVYDNTDQKEVTRLGENWEWVTRVTVTREGNFTRSGIEEVDEAEIFQGAENRLTMNQTYTWEFQCKYELKRYPFDTQVNI